MAEFGFGQVKLMHCARPLVPAVGGAIGPGDQQLAPGVLAHVHLAVPVEVLQA